MALARIDPDEIRGSLNPVGAAAKELQRNFPRATETVSNLAGAVAGIPGALFSSTPYDPAIGSPLMPEAAVREGARVRAELDPRFSQPGFRPTQAGILLPDRFKPSDLPASRTFAPPSDMLAEAQELTTRGERTLADAAPPVARAPRTTSLGFDQERVRLGSGTFERPDEGFTLADVLSAVGPAKTGLGAMGSLGLGSQVVAQAEAERGLPMRRELRAAQEERDIAESGLGLERTQAEIESFGARAGLAKAQTVAAQAKTIQDLQADPDTKVEFRAEKRDFANQVVDPASLKIGDQVIAFDEGEAAQFQSAVAGLINNEIQRNPDMTPADLERVRSTAARRAYFAMVGGRATAPREGV